MQPPEGYFEHEHWGYKIQAVSTEASVVALNLFHNEDEKRGDLKFWSEAARKHMERSRGYTFVREGTFQSPRGAGHWVLFSSRYKGVEHLYLLEKTSSPWKAGAKKSTSKRTSIGSLSPSRPSTDPPGERLALRDHAGRGQDGHDPAPGAELPLDEELHRHHHLALLDLLRPGLQNQLGP
mgnify:CR=1 FL=1